MSKDITIRHLPESVRDELKRRARDEGKSFQEYMLDAQAGALLILGRVELCGTCWLLGHDINSDSHRQ